MSNRVRLPAAATCLACVQKDRQLEEMAEAIDLLVGVATVLEDLLHQNGVTPEQILAAVGGEDGREDEPSAEPPGPDL